MKRAVSAVLAVALLAGCGSDGDDGDDPVDTRATTADEPAPEAETALFRAKDVAFTFQYPKDFAAETKPEAQVLGQVSVDPDGRLNAIKVRRTADRELKTRDYLDEFQRDFARTVGEVAKREEVIAGRPTGVLEFTDSVEQDGEAVEFTSTSYFFRGGGGTWQLECIADEAHEDEIDDACRGALDSLAFTRS